MTVQTHIPDDARTNGDEFFTAEEYAAIDRHRSPMLRQQLRNYTRGLTTAFVVLVAALGYVLWDNAERARDQRHKDAAALAERRADAAASRNQIVLSGNAVAVAGCNRDFKTIKKLRGIVKNNRAQIEAYVKDGTLTRAQGDRAQKQITRTLQTYALPDCRKSAQILTADPTRSVVVPTPLYPKHGG